MKFFAQIALFSVINAVVFSAGLNEEFTWTRVSYVSPEGGQRAKRQVDAESRFGTPQDKIVFEGETNEGEEHSNSGGGGNSNRYNYGKC